MYHNEITDVGGASLRDGFLVSFPDLNYEIIDGDMVTMRCHGTAMLRTPCEGLGP